MGLVLRWEEHYTQSSRGQLSEDPALGVTARSWEPASPEPPRPARPAGLEDHTNRRAGAAAAPAWQGRGPANSRGSVPWTRPKGWTACGAGSPAWPRHRANPTSSLSLTTLNPSLGKSCWFHLQMHLESKATAATLPQTPASLTCTPAAASWLSHLYLRAGNTALPTAEGTVQTSAMSLPRREPSNALPSFMECTPSLRCGQQALPTAPATSGPSAPGPRSLRSSLPGLGRSTHPHSRCPDQVGLCPPGLTCAGPSFPSHLLEN